MAHDFLRRILVIVPRRFLSLGIPVYLIGASLVVERVPSDFAKMSILVAGLLALEIFFGKTLRSIMRRALIYILAAFIGYLGISYEPTWITYFGPDKALFFILTAVAFAAAVKFSPRRRKIEFETTANGLPCRVPSCGGFDGLQGRLLGKSGGDVRCTDGCHILRL